MKTVLLALATTTALSSVAFAQDAITEFNIGILGGENAQDRMTSNECFRAKVEEALGVPVKLFTPADYDGVIQGLLGGTLDPRPRSAPIPASASLPAWPTPSCRTPAAQGRGGSPV